MTRQLQVRFVVQLGDVRQQGDWTFAAIDEAMAEQVGPERVREVLHETAAALMSGPVFSLGDSPDGSGLRFISTSAVSYFDLELRWVNGSPD